MNNDIKLSQINIPKFTTAHDLLVDKFVIEISKNNKKKKNNFSQEIDKFVVDSTTFPSEVFILSQIEPILKYYSGNGLFIKIKNHLDEEITIDELVDQYFRNAKDYFIIKEEKQQQQQQQKQPKPKVYGWNSVPNPTDINKTETSTIIPKQQQDQEQEETE